MCPGVIHRLKAMCVWGLQPHGQRGDFPGESGVGGRYLTWTYSCNPILGLHCCSVGTHFSYKLWRTLSRLVILEIAPQPESDKCLCHCWARARCEESGRTKLSHFPLLLVLRSPKFCIYVASLSPPTMFQLILAQSFKGLRRNWIALCKFPKALILRVQDEM